MDHREYNGGFSPLPGSTSHGLEGDVCSPLSFGVLVFSCPGFLFLLILREAVRRYGHGVVLAPSVPSVRLSILCVFLILTRAEFAPFLPSFLFVCHVVLIGPFCPYTFSRLTIGWDAPLFGFSQWPRPGWPFFPFVPPPPALSTCPENLSKVLQGGPVFSLFPPWTLLAVFLLILRLRKLHPSLSTLFVMMLALCSREGR